MMAFTVVAVGATAWLVFVAFGAVVAPDTAYSLWWDYAYFGLLVVGAIAAEGISEARSDKADVRNPETPGKKGVEPRVCHKGHVQPCGCTRQPQPGKEADHVQ